MHSCLSNHEADVDHLLATASRLSKIQTLATQHHHPSHKLRNTSRKRKATTYRTSSAMFSNGTTLTLVVSNQVPRFQDSLFPQCCSVSILIDAEPPFCFAGTKGNVDLAARVAEEINHQLRTKAATATTGIRPRSVRTSLLELVAIVDATCSRIAVSNNTSLPPSSLVLPSSTLYHDLFQQMQNMTIGSKFTLGLLHLAASSYRGHTLSDPNPLSDSLLPKGHTSHAQFTATLMALIKETQKHAKATTPLTVSHMQHWPVQQLEYLLWILCPTHGSRMRLQRSTLPPTRGMGSRGETKENTTASTTSSGASSTTSTTFTTSTPSTSTTSSTTPTTSTTSSGATTVSSRLSSGNPSKETTSSPNYVFNVTYDSESPRFNRLATEMGVVTGYHGTDACNVWSCLQNGLVTMSGTELQSNGAAFGDGVYLAEKLPVSLFYAKAWTPTTAFATLIDDPASTGLRFVFRCDVINDPKHRAFKDSDGKPLENNYLVVEDSKKLIIRQLLVFEDSQIKVSTVPNGGTTSGSPANNQVRQRSGVGSGATTENGTNVGPASATGTNNTGTPELDRSNGDDWKSRCICCGVVGFLWLLFYVATTYMHTKRRNYIEHL